jgi:hypothetical protein
MRYKSLFWVPALVFRRGSEMYLALLYNCPNDLKFGFLTVVKGLNTN